MYVYLSVVHTVACMYMGHVDPGGMYVCMYVYLAVVHTVVDHVGTCIYAHT